MAASGAGPLLQFLIVIHVQRLASSELCHLHSHRRKVPTVETDQQVLQPLGL